MFMTLPIIITILFWHFVVKIDSLFHRKCFLFVWCCSGVCARVCECVRAHVYAYVHMLTLQVTKWHSYANTYKAGVQDRLVAILLPLLRLTLIKKEFGNVFGLHSPIAMHIKILKSPSVKEQFGIYKLY